MTPHRSIHAYRPSTRQIDLGPKRAIYARDGVGHLWLVDPDARTLEAFELKDRRWSLIASLANADAVSVPPFDAISFALSNLWP
ncbi:Uma2 family endonuclease [Ruegeria sp.]|uniref:Uma2 family endonuclease n=1 Tax=Ruegeria sp. TaxID=1879320 RepID=UPI003AFF8191